MSLDYLLYHIGIGIPLALVFAIVSAVGYRLRGNIGLTVAGAVVAAVFGFGTLSRILGESLTQHSAASAFGATAVCTIISFALVYKGVESVDTETELADARYVRATAKLAAVVAGAVIAAFAATVMLGIPSLTAYPHLEPLVWSCMLLLGFVIVGLNVIEHGSKKTSSSAGEPSASSAVAPVQECPSPSPVSKWNIQKPNKGPEE